MPPRNWRYRSAVLVGLLASAVGFLFQQIVLPAKFSDQVEALIAFIAAGVLIACAVVAIRNSVVRKAFKRQEKRRGVTVVPLPEGRADD